MQVKKLCAVSNSARKYYSTCISYNCLWIPPLECKINDVCLSIESGRAWVGTINIVYGTVGSTAPVMSGLFGFCYLQLWSMGLHTKDSATNGHRQFFGDYFMYFIQHCFICRPLDSTVSEDAGIELLRFCHWQSDALTTWQDLFELWKQPIGETRLWTLAYKFSCKTLILVLSCWCCSFHWLMSYHREYLCTE